MKINFKDEEKLKGLITEEFGEWSGPLTIDQQMINEFAELSGDNMWMHIDEERCKKESPYGSTIVHGFLLLSCLPKMPNKTSVIADIEGYGFMMNYGSDRLRFVGAVPVNSSVYSRTRVKAVEVTEKNTRLTTEQHVHIVGEERPAMIYDLTMVMM